jgi:hypothetical protein
MLWVGQTSIAGDSSLGTDEWVDELRIVHVLSRYIIQACQQHKILELDHGEIGN